MILVDEPRPDRLCGEVRTSHRNIVRRLSLQVENRLRVATGRVQTQRPAAKTEQPRSIILDRRVHDLAGLEIRVDDRAAGDCNFLASQAVQTVLVEIIPI